MPFKPYQYYGNSDGTVQVQFPPVNLGGQVVSNSFSMPAVVVDALIISREWPELGKGLLIGSMAFTSVFHQFRYVPTFNGRDFFNQTVSIFDKLSNTTTEMSARNFISQYGTPEQYSFIFSDVDILAIKKSIDTKPKSVGSPYGDSISTFNFKGKSPKGKKQSPKGKK